MATRPGPRSRSVKLDHRAMDRLLRDPDGDLGRFMSRLGGYVTREAQALTAARLERHTGLYGDGFRTTTVRETWGLRTRITNRAPYASYLEDGTRPHVIRPKKPGGVLVFQVKSGATVFAKQVHHPGTRRYRIMQDALRIGIAHAR